MLMAQYMTLSSCMHDTHLTPEYITSIIDRLQGELKQKKKKKGGGVVPQSQITAVKAGHKRGECS